MPSNSVTAAATSRSQTSTSADIQFAQTNGPNADGLGIIAASKDALSDCDGDYYYSSLHTGATSWYILASQQVNPFVI